MAKYRIGNSGGQVSGVLKSPGEEIEVADDHDPSITWESLDAPAKAAIEKLKASIAERTGSKPA